MKERTAIVLLDVASWAIKCGFCTVGLWQLVHATAWQMQVLGAFLAATAILDSYKKP